MTKKLFFVAMLLFIITLLSCAQRHFSNYVREACVYISAIDNSNENYLCIEFVDSAINNCTKSCVKYAIQQKGNRKYIQFEDVEFYLNRTISGKNAVDTMPIFKYGEVEVYLQSRLNSSATHISNKWIRSQFMVLLIDKNGKVITLGFLAPINPIEDKPHDIELLKIASEWKKANYFESAKIGNDSVASFYTIDVSDI